MRESDIFFVALALGVVVDTPASAQFPFQDRDRPEMARPQPAIANEAPIEAVPADEPVVRVPAPRARSKRVAIPVPRPAPARGTIGAIPLPIGVPETVGNGSGVTSEPAEQAASPALAASSPTAHMHPPLLSQ
jgi:hypothetical protein